ncbi:MAG: SET domain-containing protein-lysine N-methyltransferase [Cyanobacteria bacterium P01_F01_bin.150]
MAVPLFKQFYKVARQRQCSSPSPSPIAQYKTSNNGYAVVMDNEGGYLTLIAQKQYSAGDIFSAFLLADVAPKPSYHSVQIDERSHSTLYPTALQYIKHSCDPNVFIDIHQSYIVCLKPIQIDEPITVFYPSTEWDMSDGFTCLCESHDCLGTVRGAKFIDSAILNRHRLSRHIKRLKSESIFY